MGRMGDEFWRLGWSCGLVSPSQTHLSFDCVETSKLGRPSRTREKGTVRRPSLGDWDRSFLHPDFDNERLVGINLSTLYNIGSLSRCAVGRLCLLLLDCLGLFPGLRAEASPDVTAALKVQPGANEDDRQIKDAEPPEDAVVSPDVLRDGQGQALYYPTTHLHCSTH